MDEKLLKAAVNSINRAYENLCASIDANDNFEAYHNGYIYETRLEYYARKLHVSESWLEDCATDVRHLGWDRC